MKKFSKLDLLKIKFNNRNRLPVGSRVIIKKCKVFPEGAFGKIIDHNTYECEYQITTVLNSRPTLGNPYILESKNGVKITQEEFDTGEFIPFDYVELADFEVASPVAKFLTSPVGLLAVGVLLFCMGGLVALEFLK